MALLLGADHPELGSTAVAAVGGRMAIALSAGALPKPYRHVDPNEDAVLAAALPDGALLCVVDGHGGFAAAAAAVEAVRASIGAPALESVFAAGRAAAVLAGRQRRGTDTALSVARVRGDVLQARTVGDTAVVVLDGGRAQVVSGVAPHLGHVPRVPPVTVTLSAGAVVLVASDGFFDACGPGWPAIMDAAAMGGDARDAAGALVRAALERGADDNVAVAVRLADP